MVELVSDVNFHGIDVTHWPDPPLPVPGGIAVRSAATFNHHWLEIEQRLGRGIGKRRAVIYIGDYRTNRRLVNFMPPDWWEVVEAVEVCENTEGKIVHVPATWGTRGCPDGYRLKRNRYLRLTVEIDGPALDVDTAAMLVERIVEKRFAARR